MATYRAGFVRRHLESVVEQRLEESPVVVLTGIRTVGKSTLLRECAQRHEVPVVDLDDRATLAQVQADPSFFVAAVSEPVCIGEFQHDLDLLYVIKSELNTDYRYGRYLLTGSTRYSALPRVAEALTGRVHVMTTWPLSQGELHGVRESFLDTLMTEPDAFRTLGARLAKTPKTHMVDSGIAAHLLGVNRRRLELRNPSTLTEFGHIVETFAVNEVLKQAGWSQTAVAFSHFRTSDHKEVDLVAETRDGAVAGVEIKASATVKDADFTGLRLLRDRLGEDFTAGVLMNLGQRAYRYEDRLYVVPMDRLWTT